MPLKRVVLPLLDRIEPLARQVGAANTVVFAAAQRLGYNTDVAGMVNALTERGITSQTVATGRAVVIGAGATAGAALAALRGLGLTSATVAVRDPARTGDVVAVAERLGLKVTLAPFEPATATDARLVISTVPAGAANSFAEIFSGLMPFPTAVLDVVYHPWPTALAAAAAQAGATVVSGFDLLLHQAAWQVRLMTDRQAPITEMRRAGLAALAARRTA